MKKQVDKEREIWDKEIEFLKSKKIEEAIKMRKARILIPMHLRSKNDNAMRLGGVPENVITQLCNHEKSRNEWTRRIRIKIRDRQMTLEMRKLEKLEKCLENGEQKPFFKIMSSWMSSSGQEVPDKSIVGGKLYTGSDVMKGLEQVTLEQSERDMMFVKDIDPDFVRMKKFNHTYSKLINHDGIKFRHIGNEEIMDKIRRMKSGKAPDIANMNKECVINMSQKARNKFCELVREMINDSKKYCATLAAISVANFLYKQKGKPRDDATSYRKLSIGSFLNKVIDTLFSNQTQDLAQKNQPELQFGFSRGVNFLNCGVLRETIVRAAVDEGKSPLMLACDVKNAFSRTSREAQMFELYHIGERSRLWEYSKSTYTNTFTQSNEY